jgi:hypothetical protein
MPQEVSAIPEHVASKKGGAALTMRKELEDAPATAAPVLELSEESPGDGTVVVASFVALRIGAGKEARKTAKKHVQAGR